MSALGVSVVVFDPKDGTVLLHQRRDFRVWALPGGGVEEGEVEEAAAIREAHEESGYHVRIIRRVGRYQQVGSIGGRSLNVCFRAEITGGEPLIGGPETMRVAWFGLDALPRSLHRFAREMIRDAASDGETEVTRTQRRSLPESLLRGLLL